MRADIIVQTQLLMAQAIFALAEHVDASTGYQLTPVAFADLPTEATTGALACISDSTVTTGIIAGGGTNRVLGWFNGTNWTVVGT
jgi:hypothetical protein